jgi:dihydropteroate synthase
VEKDEVSFDSEGSQILEPCLVTSEKIRIVALKFKLSVSSPRKRSLAGKHRRKRHHEDPCLVEFGSRQGTDSPKLGFPILVGSSRKGFLGKTLAKNGQPAPADQRLWGTAATVAATILNGAHIVRIHDVAEMAQVARVADQIINQGR